MLNLKALPSLTFDFGALIIAVDMRDLVAAALQWGMTLKLSIIVVAATLVCWAFDARGEITKQFGSFAVSFPDGWEIEALPAHDGYHTRCNKGEGCGLTISTLQPQTSLTSAVNDQLSYFEKHYRIVARNGPHRLKNNGIDFLTWLYAAKDEHHEVKVLEAFAFKSNEQHYGMMVLICSGRGAEDLSPAMKAIMKSIHRAE